MELMEFRKGIYAFPDISMPGHVALVVHPWYQDNHTRKGYNARLDEFIRTYDGILVVLEEKDELPLTSSRFLKKDRFRSHDTFFIETHPMSPEMLELSLCQFFRFLREIKSNDPVGLAGGYYWGKEKGCLGYIEHQLNSTGIKNNLLPGLFFSEIYY